MNRKPSSGSLALLLATVALCAACDGAPRPVLSDRYAELVGTWEERDEQGGLRSIWSFTAEQRFTYDILPAAIPEVADHVAGTYQLTESGLLQLDGISVSEKQRRQTSWPFYLSGDRFSPEVFVPESRKVGVLGAWIHAGDIALFDLDGKLWTQGHVSERLELSAGGSARRIHVVDANPPQILDGRFEELGADRYRVLWMDSGVELSLTLHLVNDAVLAPQVLVRKRAQ